VAQYRLHHSNCIGEIFHTLGRFLPRFGRFGAKYSFHAVWDKARTNFSRRTLGVQTVSKCLLTLLRWKEVLKKFLPITIALIPQCLLGWWQLI